MDQPAERGDDEPAEQPEDQDDDDEDFEGTVHGKASRGWDGVTIAGLVAAREPGTEIRPDTCTRLRNGPIEDPGRGCHPAHGSSSGVNACELLHPLRAS